LTKPRVRVGVVGVGALGQHHARVYSELEAAALVGVYDRDSGRAAEVATRFGCSHFETLPDLVAEADAVSVVVPTADHHAVGRVVLEAGKDVLVEKPIARSLDEADDLVALAAARGCVLQVGHIERFNPATEALLKNAPEPRFIEVHRLAVFSPRSLDVDVVLDLMIHDLDLVLALDPSELVQVDAVGVPVLTPKVDIANARLRFASGLIANLTASRVSADRVRKFRVFSSRTYVSADFSAREAQVYRLRPGVPGGLPEIAVEHTSGGAEEPLKRELAAFIAATRGRRAPVSGEDGRRALALALRVIQAMEPGEARAPRSGRGAHE
jgi:predicted dehydrogenase